VSLLLCINKGEIKMSKFKLIATASFGLESIVADELRELGYKNLKVDNGKVEFEGDEKDICKSNIWLRTADRVMLKMGEFEARSFEELFEKTKGIDWGNIIDKNGKFPVAKISSVKSDLFSKSDSQAIIKKAVVESMKKKHKVEWFKEDGADFEIKVQILKNVVTLSIDTSGEGLHKRGYRTHINQAPIKETMAAALLKLARWRGMDRALLDPTCGTGTFLIEAAMIAKNIAPGGNRNFASEKWSIVPEEYWVEAKDEAYSMETPDNEALIFGSDIDKKTIEVAKHNIELAGFEDIIHIERKDLKDISSEYKYGAIISNPPYGERISDSEEVEELYKTMGKVFRNKFDTWSYYIIAANPKFESFFGAKSDKNRKLYNGGIECHFYQYYGPRPPKFEKKESE